MLFEHQRWSLWNLSTPKITQIQMTTNYPWVAVVVGTHGWLSHVHGDTDGCASWCSSVWPFVDISSLSWLVVPWWTTGNWTSLSPCENCKIARIHFICLVHLVSIAPRWRDCIGSQINRIFEWMGVDFEDWNLKSNFIQYFFFLKHVHNWTDYRLNFLLAWLKLTHLCPVSGNFVRANGALFFCKISQH